MGEIVIRKAAIGDEQSICDVCIAGNWFTYGHLYSEDYIHKVIQQFYTVERVKKEVIETDRSWNGYFVAIEDGEIIGAIGGGMIGEKTAEVFVLYLSPERRGEGIGTKLLSHLTSVQQELYGAEEQWVSVSKDNQLGIPFYEARGFVYQSQLISHKSDPEDGAVTLRYVRNLN